MQNQTQNSDCGTRTARNKSPRSAISLTEVIISIGIMALGLLGVAALFPVGGHYLRQSEVSDRADAIAQSALSDAIARGMLNPENWLAFQRVQSNAARGSIYRRPFAPFLRSVLAQRSAALNDRSADPSIRLNAIREVNGFVGSVFVIDPLGVAEAMDPGPAPIAGFVSESIGYVPASTNPLYAFDNNINAAEPGWFPWLQRRGAQQPDNDPFIMQRLEESWPIRRLTVTTGGLPVRNRPMAPMLDQARAMVTTTDDLTIELGDYQGNPYEHSDDDPSQQFMSSYRANSNGAFKPFARESDGHFSWCLTLVPTTPEARDALGADPASFNYDVSAVVFYRRDTGGQFDAGDDFFGHQSAMLSERQVRASVASTGINGGQLRLDVDTGGEHASPAGAESPLAKLAAGQWVMLIGPHPDSSSIRPLMFCKWYRVIALEEDPADEFEAAMFVTDPIGRGRPKTRRPTKSTQPAVSKTTSASSSCPTWLPCIPEP